jgi:flagellum-specific ATP synthase
MTVAADPTIVNLRRYSETLPELVTLRQQARVTQVIGMAIEAEGLSTETGQTCEIHINHGRPPVLAEVVGFKQDRALLMALGETSGIQAGSPVIATHAPFSVPVGMELLGRVLNGLGQPLDGLGPLPRTRVALSDAVAPHPLRRPPITKQLETGVRAIDSVLTVGMGQRIGIFAGSGVGKST